MGEMPESAGDFPHGTDLAGELWLLLHVLSNENKFKQVERTVYKYCFQLSLLMFTL